MKSVIKALCTMALSIALFAVLATTACKKEEGPLERMGKDADKALEQAKDAAKDAKKDLEMTQRQFRPGFRTVLATTRTMNVHHGIGAFARMWRGKNMFRIAMPAS